MYSERLKEMFDMLEDMKVLSISDATPEVKIVGKISQNKGVELRLYNEYSTSCEPVVYHPFCCGVCGRQAVSVGFYGQLFCPCGHKNK